MPGTAPEPGTDGAEAPASPTSPTPPTSPRTRRSYLLGVGAGLGGSLAMAGCLSAFETGVVGTSDPVTLEVLDVAGPRYRELFTPLARRAGDALGTEVELVYDEVPYADVKRTLTTRASGGNPPDVAAIDQIWLGGFADAGALLSLAPVANRLDLDDFLGPLAAAATVDDEPVGVPTTTDVRGCYWNRSALEAAGVDPRAGEWTWERFLEVAREVHDPPARYGAAYFVNGGRWAVSLFGAGGEILDDRGRPAFHREPGVRAARFLDRVYNEAAVSSPQPTYRNGAHLARSFLQGTYAMTVVEGSWLDYFWRNLDREDPIRDRFGFCPTPYPADGAPATLSGGHLLAGFADTDHPELVREFLALASEQRFNRRLATGAGEVPTHRALLHDEGVWDAIEYPETVRSLLDSTNTRPVRHWASVTAELDPALQAITYDRIDPEPALAGAARAVERRLEEP